jgi:hypothetical protein
MKYKLMKISHIEYRILGQISLEIKLDKRLVTKASHIEFQVNLSNDVGADSMSHSVRLT